MKIPSELLQSLRKNVTGGLILKNLITLKQIFPSKLLGKIKAYGYFMTEIITWCPVKSFPVIDDFLVNHEHHRSY